jgi:hypothetical protein
MEPVADKEGDSPDGASSGAVPGFFPEGAPVA